MTNTTNWCDRAAECLNKLRIWPRASFLAYWVMLGYVVWWFTHLPDPSGIQMAFASLVAGLLAPVGAIYSGAMTMGANARPSTKQEPE